MKISLKKNEILNVSKCDSFHTSNTEQSVTIAFVSNDPSKDVNDTFLKLKNDKSQSFSVACCTSDNSEDGGLQVDFDPCKNVARSIAAIVSHSVDSDFRNTCFSTMQDDSNVASFEEMIFYKLKEIERNNKRIDIFNKITN